MGTPSFRFKHFEVFHDRCAMKVGTDGVLLGAWACIGNAQRILDVGSGSGLISLILAQRSTAQVDGVEFDVEAAKQAAENAASSPWCDRISIVEADFIFDEAPHHHTSGMMHLIGTVFALHIVLAELILGLRAAKPVCGQFGAAHVVQNMLTLFKIFALMDVFGRQSAI